MTRGGQSQGTLTSSFVSGENSSGCVSLGASDSPMLLSSVAHSGGQIASMSLGYTAWFHFLCPSHLLPGGNSQVD